MCLVFIGGYIKGRFTQKDVDQKAVRYIIPSDMEVTADSFEFQLTDRAGNIMLPEVYVICFCASAYDLNGLMWFALYFVLSFIEMI